MFFKSKKSTVDILFSKKNLDKYFQTTELEQKSDCYYLDFSENEFVNENFMRQKGFSKISPKVESFADNDIFLKKYIDLIGKISINNNSRKWWASEVACKNRFTTNLPFLLQQYIDCVRIIDKLKFNRLLIINPDKTLLIPIKKFVRKNEQAFYSYKSTFFFGIVKNFKIIRNVLSRLYSILYFVEKIFYVKKELKFKISHRINKNLSYYVIKSFIYDSSFNNNGNYSDVFFGSLPDYLSKKNNVIILSSILGDFKGTIKKIKSNLKYTILPYEYFITYKDLVTSFIELLINKISIPYLTFYGYNVSNVVKTEFKKTSISFSHYIYYYCIKNLLKAISVDHFFLTYESRGWENMCIMAIRKYSSNTKIIGYQHTIVPQAAAGMFVSDVEKNVCPLPDRILTVGEVTKNIIKKYGAYPDGMIQSACALRYEHIFRLKTKKRTQFHNILLALEGIPEVYRMVNYCLKELLNNKKFKLIIRTHSVLPWKTIKKHIPFVVEKSSNVSISKNTSLLEDLKKTDIVSYWGSTVSLEALSMGIPIIHYDMQSVLSYDPLFEFNDFKWIATGNDSLLDIIESIYSLSDNEYHNQAQKAKNYISRYFHPNTEENLNKFINN